MSTPGVAIIHGNMVMITGYPVIMVVIMDVVKAAAVKFREVVMEKMATGCDMIGQRKGKWAKSGKILN